MSALFNWDSEVNTIHPTFARKLEFLIRPTDVEAQKIDGITLNISEMIIAAFSVTDKANWVRLFEKIFLVANGSPEVVLGIPFLILSSADIDFLGWKL